MYAPPQRAGYSSRPSSSFAGYGAPSAAPAIPSYGGSMATTSARQPQWAATAASSNYAYGGPMYNNQHQPQHQSSSAVAAAATYRSLSPARRFEPIPPELLTPIVWDDNRLCKWCGSFCHVSHLDRCPRRMDVCRICRESFFVEPQPNYPGFPDLATHFVACEQVQLKIVLEQVARKRKEEEIYGLLPDDADRGSVHSPRPGRPRRLAQRPQRQEQEDDDEEDDNNTTTSPPQPAAATNPPPRATERGVPFRAGLSAEEVIAASMKKRNATAAEPTSSSPAPVAQQPAGRPKVAPASPPRANHHADPSAPPAVAPPPAQKAQPAASPSPPRDVSASPPSPAATAAVKPCKYCGKEFPPEHEKSCSLRPQKCLHCGARVLRSEAKAHSATCPAKAANAKA